MDTLGTHKLGDRATIIGEITAIDLPAGRARVRVWGTGDLDDDVEIDVDAKYLGSAREATREVYGALLQAMGSLEDFANAELYEDYLEGGPAA